MKAVAELTATASTAPHEIPTKSSSKARIVGPEVTQPDRMVAATASASASPDVWQSERNERRIRH